MSKRCNATFLQIYSDEETIYKLDGWRVSIFSANVDFVVLNVVPSYFNAGMFNQQIPEVKGARQV